jgi:hypothetical protein
MGALAALEIVTDTFGEKVYGRAGQCSYPARPWRRCRRGLFTHQLTTLVNAPEIRNRKPQLIERFLT